VRNGKIRIDTKTFDEYGSRVSEKHKILQESLGMPLNTSDPSFLNLPDLTLPSTNQPNPYVEIRGKLSNTKLELSLQKTVRDKGNLLQAAFDFSNKSQLIQADKDLKLRIDTRNYELVQKGQTKKLFEEYVKAGILSKDSVFSAHLFTQIAKRFFSFVKRAKPEFQKMKGKLDFSVYVLPQLTDQSTIKHVNIETNDTRGETKDFIDSFGNQSTAYASVSTKTAKFLSFYEKAFTINCKQKIDFYKNIGVGQQSLPQVFLPSDQTFRISGLSWVFMDLNDLEYRFIDRRRGILYQLSDNFHRLNSRGQTKREKSLLKIICFRRQQQKQEILLDDNLTMDRMRGLFSELDPKKIPYLVFEVLIPPKDGKIALWNDYLYAIRSFLSETLISKSHLITSFTGILRSPGKVREWVKQDKKGDALDFFKKTDFSLKTLSRRNDEEPDMNPSESYAYRVGAVARLYVDFKNEVEEESNSLRDILAYSKYDREKLRAVFERLSRGYSISKAKKRNH
jgi:hypothetical protein